MHIRDTGAAEITEANLLILINDAAQEASAAGWWIPKDDDSTVTLASGTHKYDVPAGFVAIRELRLGTNWDTIIARHYWWMAKGSDEDADFHLDPIWENTYTAGTMRITGWKRPNTVYELAHTIEPGLEAFLRDRAASHALGFMAAGGSELDRLRTQASEIKKRDSEALLQRRPDFTRIIPAPRLVPGR